MIRIAAYQATPAQNLNHRVQQIHDILARADRERIDFICFPEGFLTGYEAEEVIARKNSWEIKGTFFQKLLQELSGYRSTLILGLTELENDRIYDSVAVIEKGKLLGIQRKHYLYHTYFTPGTSYAVFESKGVSFGVIICLDANYFEPARLLSLQGAVILFCPMCNKVPPNHPYAQKPPYYSHFVARAHENRCWFVAADWVCDEEKLVCPGHSCIYDPDGREVMRSKEQVEDLLVMDISRERLFQEKGRRVHGSEMLWKSLLRQTNL